MKPERSFIKQLKRRNVKAYKRLYEAYAPLLKAVCLRYVGDKWADDVLQEGFLIVFKKIDQYKEEGSFEGWLKRIFIHKSLEHIRRDKYEKNKAVLENTDAVIGNTAKWSEEQKFDELPDRIELKQGNIDPALIEKADFTKEDIYEAMKDLKEALRIVAQMYWIDQLKHHEIAEILSIDVNTSKTRLLRAKRKLRELLYQKALNKLT